MATTNRNKRRTRTEALPVKDTAIAPRGPVAGPTQLDPLLAAIDTLTEKQRKFADVYMRTRNGPRAYQAAYETTAAKDVCAIKASELLNNPYVDLYIRGMQHINDQRQLSLDKQEVVDLFFEIARDREIPAAARVRALENLAEIAGIFTPKRLEVTGAEGQPLVPRTITHETVTEIKQRVFRIDADTTIIERASEQNASAATVADDALETDW